MFHLECIEERTDVTIYLYTLSGDINGIYFDHFSFDIRDHEREKREV